MTPITASELHALFEPIRAKGWDGWPTGLELHANITCHLGCGGAIACGFPDALTADLLLAAALRWLAEKGLANGGEGACLHQFPTGWVVHGPHLHDTAHWPRTGDPRGPTPYHAAAAALRAAMGMEAMK